MSAAHVCDECKNVAPIDEAHGWRHLAAVDAPHTLLFGWEKPEYDFCSWDCLAVFSCRVVGQNYARSART